MTLPRRVPVQARSKKRYQAIVDAAADLFGQHGFESTTMEQIAEQAGTSIGSVYQFFKDKEDVFQIMIEQLLEQAENVFSLLPMDELPQDWRTLLNSAIAGFLIALRREPKYNAAARNIHMFPTFRDKELALQTRFAVKTSEVLRHYRPELAASTALKAATVVTEIFGSSMFQISVFGEDNRANLIEEMPLLLSAYLAKYLE